MMLDFWTAVLVFTTFLYASLDGFDLGIGMLLPFVRDAAERDRMLATIAPVWDGNETWLVMSATVMFGVFPLFYATLMSAFYLPLMVMLAGLIFRGVAFEFRERSRRTKWLWDWGFIAGSYVAAFIQGMAIGALADGLPMAGTRYVGGAFGWLSPFALFCGMGLCLGYALLGAAWLAYKSTRATQQLAFRLLPRLLAGVLVFLALAFIATWFRDGLLMERWFEQPTLLLLPLAGLAISALMATAIARRLELAPFLCAVALFAVGLGTFVVSFYPYMIPFAITTTEAAAPHSSQAFLFWGVGVFVMPLTVAYSLVIYFLFKGKVGDDDPAY
ncbi:cytochrome d ubiquinol oxidase subunit II [Paraburkholderia sp. D15]|uniref:cytochrome d ubiquinol oxidase subunit II n=1 Tax=Paraburkholderia sp. D15 TaxID=2880218 RepID=UPI00247A44BA|nr:cytochrome d ubiquinol oxidase subunit II [Paraburkholderia sp. D15]WGS54060.1 cytochrome d ubiquinol oxidase subunit II [Paraburkholderia sp. D15]